MAELLMHVQYLIVANWGILIAFFPRISRGAGIEAMLEMNTGSVRSETVSNRAS